MTLSVLALAFDCADAGRLASFWAAALHREVDPGATADFAAVAPSPDSDGTAPDPLFTFHRVPEGKTAKNRLHLDLLTLDMDAESRRLISLGASRVRELAENGHRWATFTDPEGNEFDLIAG